MLSGLAVHKLPRTGIWAWRLDGSLHLFLRQVQSGWVANRWDHDKMSNMEIGATLDTLTRISEKLRLTVFRRR